MSKTLVSLLILLVLVSVVECNNTTQEGQGHVTVVATGGRFSEPIWSTDGKRILVVRSSGDGQTLEVFSQNGRDRDTVLRVGDAPKSPGWLSDDIIFLNGYLETTALQRITGTGRTATLQLPGTVSASWSRDGRYGILKKMHGNDANDLRLWSLETTTMEQREVVSGVALSYFRISPSGRYVAVSSNDTSGSTLFVQDLETGAVTEQWHVSRSEGAMGDLAWSPDEKVVGVRRIAGNEERGFYLLAREGSAIPYRLTTVDMVYPDWSPDGTRIVYTTAGAPTGKNDLAILVLPSNWRQQVLLNPKTGS